MKINIKNIRVRSICATLFISLFLSCNNGVIEELEKRNIFLSSLANLGNDFLNIFTSFGDTIGSSLGFNAETKKSGVRDYFKKVHDTVKSTKDKLEKLVADMKTKDNPNATETEAAVTALNEKLTKIIEGAKTVSDAIGDIAKQLIANVADQRSPAGVKGDNIDSIVTGIKSIVEVVLKDNGSAQAGDTNGPVKDGDGQAGTARGSSIGTDGDARHLFANNQAGAAVTNTAKAAKDAAKVVGAVTGADILKAMIQDSGNASKLASNNDSDHTNIVTTITNTGDAEIAGGIALRAMAKNGTFASVASIPVGTKKAIEDAAVSAITKTLNILTIAIRKTVDKGFKTVKDAMKLGDHDSSLTADKGGAS
ncbi:variable large family protein (plasmid) [Borrelia coriaceae]|uniref:Variable large protein n=1 Tax=Borrelia coriaceae ATCC 43381 TaxID=1408429 RepID=W5SX24_9SPIR|nr:variable large family protein [Borrelia coriaceae]AHH11450.1 Variable outer membrane protein [Borrelia coriaceae ATCC 43381]UPA17283.1 variable large family protein [Borrelia coriaceae]